MIRRHQGDWIRGGAWLLPSQPRGLGKCRKLPQCSLGKSPSSSHFLFLWHNETHSRTQKRAF